MYYMFLFVSCKEQQAVAKSGHFRGHMTLCLLFFDWSLFASVPQLKTFTQCLFIIVPQLKAQGSPSAGWESGVYLSDKCSTAKNLHPVLGEKAEFVSVPQLKAQGSPSAGWESGIYLFDSVSQLKPQKFSQCWARRLCVFENVPLLKADGSLNVG